MKLYSGNAAAGIYEYIKIYGEGMSITTTNKYGLFDAPIRATERERIRLTPAMLEEQLDAGAFLLSREQALAVGLLSPYDDETVCDVIITEHEE